MCGHFAIDYLKLAQLIERYSLSEFPETDQYFRLDAVNHYYPSRGNSESYIPAIVNQDGIRKLFILRWDLVPNWWNRSLNEKRYASFNARSDSLAEKATYKNAWMKRQRCIVPATAFYEWPDKKKMQSEEKRTEHKIFLKDLHIFSMAGIWDSCRLPESERPLFSCAIVTTEANSAISKIPHERMPTVLSEAGENEWLNASVSPDAAFKMLHPYPDEMLVIQKGQI